MRQQFEHQRSDIIGNASTKALKGYSAKAVSVKDKRNYLAALVAWSVYDDTMRKALAPILYALIVETGKQAMQQISRDPSQFDPTTLSILNQYQHRATKISTDVNAETEKQLRASISKGIDQGESQDELQARIEAVMGAALTYRANRIAQTEVTRAQGFGDIEAWLQAGTVTGKEWYTAQDERVCPFCDSLDGTIISLDDNFLALGDVMRVGGQELAINYEDVDEPPAHVNCRCQLLPVEVPLADL